MKTSEKRFPDYLDRPTAPELSEQIEASLVDGADATPFYDSWSDKWDDYNDDGDGDYNDDYNDDVDGDKGKSWSCRNPLSYWYQEVPSGPFQPIQNLLQSPKNVQHYIVGECIRFFISIIYVAWYFW